MKIVLLAREDRPVRLVTQMYGRWSAELLALGVECEIRFAGDYAAADEILAGDEMIDMVLVRDRGECKSDEACAFVRKLIDRGYPNRIVAISARQTYEAPLHEAGATDFVLLVGNTNPLLDLVPVFRRPTQ